MLIVGLGNPGKEYEYTRHNSGFIAVDILATRYHCSWLYKAKFKAFIAGGDQNSDDHKNDRRNEHKNGSVSDSGSKKHKLADKIILCKPDSFMNLSGEAVQKLVNYYKIALQDIVVIHDDIDLEFGRFKYKTGGSSAGHNGLRSIDQTIGNNYSRIRIGIGRPKPRLKVCIDGDSTDLNMAGSPIAAGSATATTSSTPGIADFVLTKFSQQEYEIITTRLNLLSANISLIANKEKFKQFLATM